MTDDLRKYGNAIAFRRALEDRLKNIACEQALPLERLRRRITFDRFLARLFEPNKPNQQWLLKGGYALEFRFHNVARTTKDIDFSIPHMKDPDEKTIRELLQTEAKKDISDWFQFYIGVPMREFNQAVYGGWRYPVEARVANRIFSKFHVDVGIGDAVISKAEWKKGDDILGFAGIEPVCVAMLPVEQHFAEKIHAYSYPREKRSFSRIRDLVDLVLLIEQGLPDKALIVSAIEATFKRRNTHDIPKDLEIPPEILEDSYSRMAEDCGVTKKTMSEAFLFLQGYWLELRK
ncbi:MAG: nucleotidyl transferase AbiEii/AbiGii toxin family protein [Candidatus Auribacterota bacterium]|nr:nucleotidyl transferase AbiEii/AbiGii toxin family protein [Candidatus Auribacterota bacterium]